MASREAQVKEIIKCGQNPTYFIDKYVKIQHPLKGLIPLETFDYQKRCINDFEKHRFNIVLKSRQLGLSTIAAAYAVWLAIYHREKNILIIATKLPTALNFIKKVKVALAGIPSELKITKEVSVTKSEITFDNGSQIKAIPRSEDAGRSEALSLLIVDECVTGDALITVRNKYTQEEMILSIFQFYEILKYEQQKDTSSILIEYDEDMDASGSDETVM
jgi:hypothetical protein